MSQISKSPTADERLRESEPGERSYRASGQYRATHIRSLRLAMERILAQPEVLTRFEGVRYVRLGAVRCDVCSQLCKKPLRKASCLLCEATVHRDCYAGVLLLKEDWGDWLCDRCFACGLQMCDPTRIVCLLCEQSVGALKWTEGAGWIHPGCVLFSKKIGFVDSLQSKTKEKSGKPESKACIYCRKVNKWTIKCAERGCFVEFHYKCGQLHSLFPQHRGFNGDCYCEQHKVSPSEEPEQFQTPLPESTLSEKKLTNNGHNGLTTYFVDAGEELEVYTIPVDPAADGKTESRQSPVTKAHFNTIIPRQRNLPIDSSPPSSPPPKKTSTNRTHKRLFFEAIRQLTNITEPGTLQDLQNQLKGFLRRNKLKADINFYDISHLPGLSKLIGRDGKVEHNSLEAIVLANSYLVG